MGLTLYRTRPRPVAWRVVPAALLAMAPVLTSLHPARGAGMRDPRSATIEALALVEALLRRDTGEPPGSGIHAARILAVFLSQKGIGCELLQPEPGRATLLCRLRGIGSERPLLVVARLGATPAAESGAGADPNAGGTREARPAGEPRSGRVCGPGLLEGRGMAAATAEALSVLSLQKPPRRDVFLLVAADGETTSGPGLEWVLDHRPELRRAELALTEGGGWIEAGGRRVAAGVDVDRSLMREDDERPLCGDDAGASLPRGICRALERLEPGIRVQASAGAEPPFPGLLRRRGIPAYGLISLPLNGAREGALGHGAGGCVSLESFDLAVRVMVEMLRELAGPSLGSVGTETWR